MEKKTLFFSWIHPLISPFQNDAEIWALTIFQVLSFVTFLLNGWLYKLRLFYKGTPRQRGRGLGALAGTIARTAFRIFRKYVLPTAKKLGKDVIEAALPELGEVIAGRSSIRKATKRAAKTQ